MANPPRRTSNLQNYAPPNPFPQFADPKERQQRKEKEKEAGGFDWEQVAELTLTAAFAAFSIDKALSSCNEKSETKSKDNSRDKKGGEGGGGRSRGGVDGESRSRGSGSGSGSGPRPRERDARRTGQSSDGGRTRSVNPSDRGPPRGDGPRDGRRSGSRAGPPPVMRGSRTLDPDDTRWRGDGRRSSRDAYADDYVPDRRRRGDSRGEDSFSYRGKDVYPRRGDYYVVYPEDTRRERPRRERGRDRDRDVDAERFRRSETR